MTNPGEGTVADFHSKMLFKTPSKVTTLLVFKESQQLRLDEATWISSFDDEHANARFFSRFRILHAKYRRDCILKLLATFLFMPSTFCQA
jgi:hypothetical protein